MVVLLKSEKISEGEEITERKRERAIDPFPATSGSKGSLSAYFISFNIWEAGPLTHWGYFCSFSRPGPADQRTRLDVTVILPGHDICACAHPCNSKMHGHVFQTEAASYVGSVLRVCIMKKWSKGHTREPSCGFSSLLFRRIPSNHVKKRRGVHKSVFNDRISLKMKPR